MVLPITMEARFLGLGGAQSKLTWSGEIKPMEFRVLLDLEILIP
jgi:hypothetical protein